MQLNEIGFQGLRLRSTDTENGQHTVEGIAVPFGQTTKTWEGTEVFDRDTTFDGLDSAKLCLQHGEVIGAITKAESTDAGLRISAVIADTVRGREAIALMDVGALDSMSVGFVPNESETDADGIIHRRSVTLYETSLVSWPAYSQAKITNHREKENTKEEKTMTEENTNLDGIETRMSTLEQKQRELAAAAATQNTTPAVLGVEFRSSGDFMRQLSSGDQLALDTYENLMKRDFKGSTLADTATQAQWVTDMINLVSSRRSILDIFDAEPLPAKGDTVSYRVLASNSTTVEKQATEGTDLPFGKVTLGTKSATIGTYGGYTMLSQQAIDRSDTPAVTTAWNAMALAYAKNTETAGRTHLYTAIKTQAATDSKLTFDSKALTAATADDWIDIFIDAAEALDDLGAIVGTFGVSKDVFKALAKLQRDGNSLLDISGLGASTLGTIDLTSTAANIGRVNVRMLPKADAGTAAFIDPTAVKKWESSGAPFRLQDQNVINLSQDFSAYGYLALGTPWPEGILPIVGAATTPTTEPAGSGE